MDLPEHVTRPAMYGGSRWWPGCQTCGVAGKDDPRVTSQERFIQGATFERRAWSSQKPDWDHDHCEFCWVHFGDHVFSDDADTQLEGWRTPDGDHWVCRTCFADFRDAFQFHALNAEP